MSPFECSNPLCPCIFRTGPVFPQSAPTKLGIRPAQLIPKAYANFKPIHQSATILTRPGGVNAAVDQCQHGD